MTGPKEEAPELDSRGFDQAAYPPTPPHDTRQDRQKPPTQAGRVFTMLSRGWVCGTEFLEAHLPRYGARIYDLRQDGWYVSKRQCQHPWHRHRSVQWQWRIERKPPVEGQLFGDES
jgi:hypothetical protein